jgi:crotonobetainyl-CoA:carnitine CoA-transferase CaiB-like acyl-CoA transferase
VSSIALPWREEEGNPVERALEGVKVLEVSAWAFVPSAGAVLADWGAEVVKVEPPDGDPMRGLITGGITGGPSFPWEIWNRGKRSIGLDLTNPGGRDLLLRLVEDADVFLTSYLPGTRRKLGIDIEDVRGRNPAVIYACGSGQGPLGDEADRGGYDAISFWARGGVAAATTPPDAARPVSQPSGAFGDSLSGMGLAGGIAAALLRRTRTGEGAVVDVSLLGTAMWCMQMSIVGGAVMVAASAPQDAARPPMAAPQLANPLVNSYETSDGRWLALCMLQRDRYWDGVLAATGREDLRSDPRFADPSALSAHTQDAADELARTFRTRTLAEWRTALAGQTGQWDVVANIFEVPRDPQAVANGYVQPVSYEGGVDLPLVSAPAQIDRTPPALRPAPAFNGDADDLLAALGMTEDEILEARIAGALA